MIYDVIQLLVVLIEKLAFFNNCKGFTVSVMVEKGIRGGICQSIYRYAKANNKHIKDNDKNKESSYLQYWNVNKLYGWAICHKSLQ